MKKLHTKKFYKKKIQDFIDNLKRPVFEQKYLMYHRYKIDALYWLLAYYDGRTASTPKKLLESYINGLDTDNRKSDLEWIRILYNWENYKEIVGF